MNTALAIQPNTTLLSSLSVGEEAVVSRLVDCPSLLRTKLHAMGVVTGKRIKVLHHAPLGDPMTISILGFHLALRLSEAAYIEVITYS